MNRQYISAAESERRGRPLCRAPQPSHLIGTVVKVRINYPNGSFDLAGGYIMRIEPGEIEFQATSMSHEQILMRAGHEQIFVS